MIVPHAHHWLIERPDGPTSHAVCICGAEREFANNDDKTTRGKPWRPAPIAHLPVTAPICRGCGNHPRTHAHKIACAVLPGRDQET